MRFWLVLAVRVPLVIGRSSHCCQRSSGQSFQSLMRNQRHQSNSSRRRLATIATAILLFVISTLSFAGNHFAAANPIWFQYHQIDSEQLVLDGLLHSRVKKSGTPSTLGIYGKRARSSGENQALSARLFYETSNISGKFGAYQSQYGLQLKLLNMLQPLASSLNAMQLIVAAAMGFCLSVSYLILRAHGFHGISATGFVLCFAFSPWVIVFARNLYWVQFTWMLPSIVAGVATVCYVRLRGAHARLVCDVVFAVCFFLAVVAKLLCGYEYITVVYFASVLTFALLLRRQRYPWRPLLRRMIAMTIIFALAFASAIGLHARQLAQLGKPGLEIISRIAAKRVHTGNVDQVIEKECPPNLIPDERKRCLSLYRSSLTSNPLKVAYRYLFIPDFFPWLSSINAAMDAIPDQGQLAVLKSDIRSSSIHTALVSLLTLSGDVSLQHRMVLAAAIMLRLALPLLIVLLIVAFRSDGAMLVSLFLLFLGSASWFVMAKGHSFIHYHMNYVLWYFLFIPASVLLLVEQFFARSAAGSRQRHTAAHQAPS